MVFVEDPFAPGGGGYWRTNAIGEPLKRRRRLSHANSVAGEDHWAHGSIDRSCRDRDPSAICRRTVDKVVLSNRYRSRSRGGTGMTPESIGAQHQCDWSGIPGRRVPDRELNVLHWGFDEDRRGILNLQPSLRRHGSSPRALTSKFAGESPTKGRFLRFRYFGCVHGFWYSILSPGRPLSTDAQSQRF